MADALKRDQRSNTLPATPEYFMITESGHGYGAIEVTQPLGHTVEDALRPEYWVNVAHKLKANPMTGQKDWVGSVLDLRTKDHAHFAKLYVLAVHERSLDVQLLGEPTSLGIKTVDIPGFEVRWNDAKREHEVIRTSDRQVVGGFKTKALAKAWIEKTIGKAAA